MGKRKMRRRGGMQKRQATEAEKKEERECKILVHTSRQRGFRNFYGEFYTIDLEKHQVIACPHALYKDLGLSSMVASGSVIYLIGGPAPERAQASTIDTSENPNLHCYDGSSCLDLNDDDSNANSSGWKPADVLKFNDKNGCFPNCLSFCGKIYVFGFHKADVFDPQSNSCHLLLPPPGVDGFYIAYPVVGDPSNHRLFVCFEHDRSVYAYYPVDSRWELFAQHIYFWPFASGAALVDGVIYFYLSDSLHAISAAFDVETRQWLHVDISSEFEFHFTKDMFDDLLDLGNGVLCLVGHYNNHNMNAQPETETYVEALKMKVRRTGPQNVLVTLLSFNQYTIPTYCSVSKYLAL